MVHFKPSWSFAYSSYLIPAPEGELRRRRSKFRLPGFGIGPAPNRQSAITPVRGQATTLVAFARRPPSAPLVFQTDLAASLLRRCNQWHRPNPRFRQSRMIAFVDAVSDGSPTQLTFLLRVQGTNATASDSNCARGRERATTRTVRIGKRTHSSLDRSEIMKPPNRRR